MELEKIVKQLNWRIATKSFDPTKKVFDADFERLMEAARLSPSSLGLQPWKFVVVRDPKVRQLLSEAGYNQPQITQASHLVVLCSKTDLTPEYITKYINSIDSI